MKKIVSITSIVSLLFLSACKKEYTCVCTSKNGSKRVAEKITVTGLGGIGKSKIESRCSNYSSSNEDCKITTN
jgi:hypothetical protein